MVKYYCDHCGKDISEKHRNDLGVDDCYYKDGDAVGYGCILCDDCWDKRLDEHIRLDIKFLNLKWPILEV